MELLRDYKIKKGGKEFIVTIDDLYKAMKHHDRVILSRFNENSLSDVDYFILGLNEDIFANGLSLLTNLFCANEDSIGVDAACRSIIEAFVIIKMYGTGKINEEQLRVFRSQYAITEYFAVRKILGKNKNHPAYQDIKANYEKAVAVLAKYFKCEPKQMAYTLNSQMALHLDDPNVYLKKNPTDRIDFVTLLKENPVFGEDQIRAYEFFSLFTHPYFENNERFSAIIKNLRKAHINAILRLLYEFMADCKLFLGSNVSETSFQEDFYENDQLKHVAKGLCDLDQRFKGLISRFGFAPDSYDAFYLCQLNSLSVDMMVSISLGYKESVLTKFKLLMEMAGVHRAIRLSKAEETDKMVELAFLWSSRAQIETHFSHISQDSRFGSLKSWKELYRAVYKDLYKEPSFNAFFKNVKSNSLYFLRKGPKSYRKLIMPLIDELSADRNVVTLIKTTESFANDISHSGGYAFNATPGIVDVFPLIAYQTLWRYLASLTMKYAISSEKKAEKDEDFAFFAALANLQNEEINNLLREYQTVML